MKPISMVSVMLMIAPLALAAPPAAKKEPVTDTYHGAQVVDEYRWLEDSKSKDVQAWSDAENAYARTYLDKLPGRETLRNRVKEILEATTMAHYSLAYRPGMLFAMKRLPPKQQPFLVVMPSAMEPDKARTLVDPTQIDAKGLTSIDWYVPSPDGSLVAVSLSKAGSEAGDVHIYETSTGKPIADVIPRVQNGTAGGDLAWTPDGKGFYYTRYPRGKERPPEDADFYQQVWFHELGTPSQKDRYEIGKDFPRIGEIRLFVHQASGRLLVAVQNGDGGEFAHYLRDTDGKFRQFSDFPDRAIQALFGPHGETFVVSLNKAPRGKLLQLGDDLNLKTAKTIIPEGKDTIVTDFYGKPTIVATASRLYLTYQTGGPQEVRPFTLRGKELASPAQPPVSATSELTPLEGDDLIFANSSFVQPPAQYLFRVKAGEVIKTKLIGDPPVSLADIRVERKFAVSKDGAKVPVNILIPKGAKLDGSNPCLLTGYGGYGINITPGFSSVRRILADHGCIVAVANLRGGGEYGEEWHHAGRLTEKQNVFDDFAAAMKLLIDDKYTSRDKLAIEGGSNGGLLMGAILTQHPDTMKCVISHVGIYDMLRVELSPNGAFNVPEFGTVKDSTQFRALLAYSPYHNVKDGTKYPATLFMTGANDPRVDPMQSRKMTARLQAATAGDAPILLRTSSSSGHGRGTALSERIEQITDAYAFLFAQLGVKE
jgi:prolyl oligopeptidase